MRKLLLLSFTLLVYTSIVSQNLKISATTKMDIHKLKESYEHSKLNNIEELKLNYPINLINQTYYVSLIAQVDLSFKREKLNALDILFGSQIKNIVTLKVPLDRLSSIFEVEGIVYLELASKIRPLLDKAVKDVRADSVHLGINLPQSYTGKNVVIGITDWGFDYTQPMFYDTSLTETRILGAWDQYKQSGPSPSGFNYGTAYESATDLLAAQSDTANIYSYATHGTHVAGIAGGSGAGTVYRGVGFESSFLFTTFLIDAASVIDAYSWMKEKADAAGKRLVINQSWGLHHIGTLDGTSMISQAIDGFSEQGVVFVSSAGNNGDVDFHIKKTFSADTLQTKIDFYPYSAISTMWGQSISLWGEVGKDFSTRLRIQNAMGDVLNETDFFSTATTLDYIDTFMVVGSDTVFYNLAADAVHPLNNRSFTRLRIKSEVTSYKIVLNVTAPDGTVHMWNVVELTNDVGNWGMPFSSLGTGYTAGDNAYGISEPACTESVISVGSYIAEYYTGVNNQTLVGGGVSYFSSYGPTMDERQKPDITAPGSSVASSLSSFTDGSYSTLGTTVDFNGRTYYFAKFSGTSMASPMVTGVVSLILEANPYLSAEQVKDIIIQTAREDLKTGDIPDSGSYLWGHGKINAYHAVQLALQTESIENHNLEYGVFLFPNPAVNQIEIASKFNWEKGFFNITTVDGKVVSEGVIQGQSINISGLNDGTYYVRLRLNDTEIVLPFIKN
jgi:minor extracellular serine protease Vpr